MASVHVMRDEGGAARTCLHPSRADLTFQNVGVICDMNAVDRVENLGGGKDLYMPGRSFPLSLRNCSPRSE